jgi:tetrahydromethanopterin S-methyltransferase subunit A
MKVVFAPQALANLVEEVGEEEAQRIIKEIEESVADGSFFADSEPLNLEELEQEDPEAYEEICKQIEAMPVEERMALKPTYH